MQGRLFSMLSGGEKNPVNLARLLLEKTDILLLDEPTNHLDMKSVEWLEEYILRFKGTVLTISHDRYFLDRIVQRIVELRGGKAEFYTGNYSAYVVEKTGPGLTSSSSSTKRSRQSSSSWAIPWSE